MGRPLNKRFFGEPTVGGNEIKVRFFAAGQAEANGWIVKQLGSKKFRCNNGDDNPGDCTLVDKAQGTLAAGEMTITVKDDGGTARQVTKISGRMVTLDTGAKIAWGFDAYGAVTDQVEMEEAGTDDAFTGADDFEA
jgi:hypothetical protein